MAGMANAAITAPIASIRRVVWRVVSLLILLLLQGGVDSSTQLPMASLLTSNGLFDRAFESSTGLTSGLSSLSGSYSLLPRLDPHRQEIVRCLSSSVYIFRLSGGSSGFFSPCGLAGFFDNLIPQGLAP